MSKVGDKIEAPNSNWSFGGDVSKHFDGHVEKSIPFYHEGHDLCAKVSDFFLINGSVCCEIGCSTGQLTSILAERAEGRDVTFIGIDEQEGMIEEARAKCAARKNVSFRLENCLESEIESADLVVSYYTMQFISPRARQWMFDKIYESLNWGGGLLLFEKVRAPDSRFQDMMTSIYTDFKLDMGYSPEEIVSKTRSLKGVMEPFSTQGNIDLMARAGFKDIMTIFKYACFEGYLAIK